jgi:LmbE family N-acetylglucosaminyl deacetylase
MAVVLVVAPHPDDEVLGCGGVIARHVDRGDVVYAVIVSKGDVDFFAPEFVEQARAEAAAAARLLGTRKLFFLDFPAPLLDQVPTAKMAAAIREVIQQVRADIVYLPHQGDIHEDHKAVYRATLVASRPNSFFYPQRLLSYEVPSETEWGAPLSTSIFAPTLFVNTTEYLNKKLAAMSCYKSQLPPDPEARSLFSINALAQVRGATIGVRAAEAFMIVREVIH